MSATYTMRETAQILGVTPRTVQRWRVASQSTQEPRGIAPLTLTEIAQIIEEHRTLLAKRPNPSPLLRSVLNRLAQMTEAHVQHAKVRRQSVKESLRLVR